MNLVHLVTYRAKVPAEHQAALDELASKSRIAIDRMLANRSETSTKFYPEVPSVLAKSLSRKYQRNEKCKSVSRLCLPVCGDKGKQVKVCDEGLRIPALFKKAVIPCQLPLPISGFIRHVELFRRGGDWFMSYGYNTPCTDPITPNGAIGVDRNSVGNIAVLADPQTGHVRHLGFNPARTKQCWRNRKRNLQRQGKRRLLSKLRRNHARRSKHQNHVVSKTVVDYAKQHSRAIALEKLDGITKMGSKIRSYSERNQWAFAQLAQFIQYKARLAGVPVIEVDPAYTSQTCSRCGHIHKPEGKSFRCPACGHQDHRDANAAFNIARRGVECIGGLVTDSARRRCGLIDGPRSGKLVANQS
jgi:putative transposase